jgi:hypothetical protein
MSFVIIQTTAKSNLEVNTVHSAKIIGSIAIGNEEISSVIDLETGCTHKTFLHTTGLFSENEIVQISFKSHGELAEIIKYELSETVFVNKCTINASANGPTIGILCCDIARPRNGCKTGGGLCNCRGGLRKCGVIKSTINADYSREASSNFRLLNNNEILEVEFITPLPVDVTQFEFDELTELDSSVSEATDFKTISIQSGIYPIDYSNNKFGTIYLKIITTK